MGISTEACSCILTLSVYIYRVNERHCCVVMSVSEHFADVIMTTIASQITSLTVVYSDADQRKHQSSASLAFVWWIHRGPVNSPHKGPVTRKMFPFDDVIMNRLWPITFHEGRITYYGCKKYVNVWRSPPIAWGMKTCICVNKLDHHQLGKCLSPVQCPALS